MRALVLLSLLFALSAAHARPPYVVEGSRSPDGRWAVAVLSDRTGDEAMLAEEDHPEEKTAYLVHAGSRRRAAPLADVPTDGGSWGHTRTNVEALWSTDGRFVACNFRAGRLSRDFVCYAVDKHGRVRRQTLSGEETHPKWPAYAQLKHGPNGRTTATRWTSPTGFVAEESGVFLPDSDEAVQALPDWLEGFSDTLEWIYAYEDGRWVLKDIRVPEKKPAGSTGAARRRATKSPLSACGSPRRKRMLPVPAR